MSKLLTIERTRLLPSFTNQRIVQWRPLSISTNYNIMSLSIKVKTATTNFMETGRFPGYAVSFNLFGSFWWWTQSVQRLLYLGRIWIKMLSVCRPGTELDTEYRGRSALLCLCLICLKPPALSCVVPLSTALYIYTYKYNTLGLALRL